MSLELVRFKLFLINYIHIMKFPAMQHKCVMAGKFLHLRIKNLI